MDVTNAMVLEAGEKEQEYAERVLMIPLCLAERAWSYAMQLKQEVSEQPRKRFHLVRRLKKAAEYATKFEKLCHDPESPCSDRTKREATAYACYINGLYKLERENWAEAKEDLYKTLTIYFTLSLSVKKDEVLEYYRQKIDELRASLRYCTFNLGDKAKDIKTKLPTTLQFHDLAYRHVKQLQEQEAIKDAIVEKEEEEEEEEENEKAKAEGKKENEKALQDGKKEKLEPSDRKESDQSDEDDSDDDVYEEASSGVTGFVKGWLGGWS